VSGDQWKTWLTDEGEEWAERGVFEERAGGGVEEEGVDELGGCEAFGEAFGELALDGFAGCGPCSDAVCVGDEMGEGGFG
jgi:hypothetical protein